MNMPGFNAEEALRNSSNFYRAMMAVTFLKGATARMSFGSPVSRISFKGCCFCTENYGCLCFYPCPLPSLGW